MTVFRGFVRVLSRNLGFVAIFTAIMVVMGLMAYQSPPGGAENFTADKPKVILINQGSETALTRAFESYLRQRTSEADVNSTDREIDDALYYEALAYAVYLPADFTDKILNGQEPTVGIKSRASAQSASAEALVTRFLRLATGYGKYLTDEDELVKAIESSAKLSTDVVLTSQLDTKTLKLTAGLYNFGSYTLMAGCVYVITMVLAAFAEVNVRRRTIVSSANPLRIDLNLNLGCAIIMLLLAALNVGLVSVLIPESWATGRGGLFALNTFVFGLPVLALGFLITKITTNKEALSAIVNVVALASAFLCGAFIPPI
ncbi:ABC transporter permease [uncultured Mobiluncus sp.]|uniref:ABC transporter permease n=1 Tax=uncultured Mobiluncus sp. TaxID=293425 RepID=UPI0027D9387A|nr:ABC transporter permease [uncultured Mobiluncus sp.]